MLEGHGCSQKRQGKPRKGNVECKLLICKRLFAKMLSQSMQQVLKSGTKFFPKAPREHSEMKASLGNLVFNDVLDGIAGFGVVPKQDARQKSRALRRGKSLLQHAEHKKTTKNHL